MQKAEHYNFETTPKHAFELFTWLFTEPIKLQKFSASLSRKGFLGWYLKTAVWIGVAALLLWLVTLFLIVLFELPEHFPEVFSASLRSHWETALPWHVQFFSLLQGTSSIFFTKLAWGLAGGLAWGLAGGLAFGLAFGLAVGLAGGLAGGLAWGLAEGLAGGLGFIGSYFAAYFGIHAYLLHLLRYGVVGATLTRNPYTRDSSVALPLPGLHTTLSRQSFDARDVALAFIRFLFAFRPHQRRFAFHLRHVINASAMFHTPLTPQVITIPEAFEKEEPTADVVDALRSLKEVLTHYATGSTNPHDRIARLKQASDLWERLELLMLQERRTWKDFYLKAFEQNRREAQTRITYLEAEIRRAEPVARNVYNSGHALRPDQGYPIFKGRTDLIAELSRAVYRKQLPPVIQIQGQRRVGKTSLIHYLEPMLGSGFKLVMIDMQDGALRDLNAVIAALVAKINAKLQIDAEVSPDDDPLRSWDNFQTYLIEHTRQTEFKLILAIDEYEDFHKKIVHRRPEGGELLGALRSFTQAQERVILLFSGVLRFSDLKEPSWDRYFPHKHLLWVDYLATREATELITSPVPDFGLRHTDATVAEILRLTQGHPNLLQALCGHLVDAANDADQNPADPAMVRDAAQKVVGRNEDTMSIFWREFCGPDERAAIEQILAGEKVPVNRAVARLIEYGFITPEHTIRVPLFETWLREKRILIDV